ncbi:hypothetical protein GGQ92_001892 [Gracilibacillus halotolerans]|uniref:Uncharacterized protein n=1 Tax=Gracilibacillus halotolerans TaxID=74386 RepID=A0A841RMG6_9BACI|nr:hypothetical protein [Gracilibacillus halotolerans]
MYIVTAEEVYELDKYRISEGGINERIFNNGAGSTIY